MKHLSVLLLLRHTIDGCHELGYALRHDVR